MDIERLNSFLTSNIAEKVYVHCLGTAETASKLALSWGAEPVKAYIAGLVHDYAKQIPGSRLLEICLEAGMSIDPVAKINPCLLHGPAAAVLLPREAGIMDPEILDAVRVHTTGEKTMGRLAKVLYLADLIEPGRSYPGVDDLRRAAAENPEDALLLAANQTIAHVIRNNQLLHPATVEFRNYLLLEKSGGS